MRIWVVGAALAMAGCVFDPSVQALATDADPNAPDADPFAADADPAAPDADPTAPDANPDANDAALPTSLVDTGLVVRYFMDEAPSGTGPAELVDSAPTPLPVPITYAGDATYVESGGNRGLRWASTQNAGKAQVNFGATKLYTRLRPSATVTIEVVADIDNASTSNSGSQVAGLRGGNPDFMLTANGTDIRFYRPFGSLGATWEGINSQERMVLHLVYDSTDGNSANRIELYKDGVLVPKTTSSPPNQNQSVGLGSSDSLLIGNNPNADSSIEGTIYYVAMYDQALGASDIAANAARLLASDDQ